MSNMKIVLLTAVLGLAGQSAAQSNSLPTTFALSTFPGFSKTSAGAAGPTDAPSEDCINALLDVAGDVPFPPQDIIDWEVSAATAAKGDPCAIQTLVPASLSAEWSSYQGQVLSWYTAHSSEIQSALSKCPSDYSSSVGPGICSGGAKATGGGSGSGSGSGATDTGTTVKATTTGSGAGTAATTAGGAGSTGSGSASGGTVTKNAGAKETSLVAGVVAMVGLVGGVAVFL